ncbi:hypothetical protein M9H77_03891 [Catharanthus roseus]|uniref:Uncharacterized protein n=1 Tax=Catharanthus roseus TaxID=4058 RepID=A0ACC0CD16_CATRO|nr:hypothetical protein M9H77_03891 [Catharanthus roseus]
MLGRFTFDLDPVDRGRSTVGGLDPRRGYFLIGWVKRGSLAMVAQGALVDLLVLLVLEIAGRLTAKVTLMRGTLEAQHQIMTQQRWVESANRPVRNPAATEDSSKRI